MKLDGLTVIDLSLFLPGPAATQIMADHGARVIKVENPSAPEPTRSAAAFPHAGMRHGTSTCCHDFSLHVYVRGG